MVAELNEDPSADHDAAETPDGGQQRGGTFTIPKLLAILFGLLASLTTTSAQRVTVPNGTSASPGRPQLHFYRMYDGYPDACDEEDSATATWILALVLAAAVTILLARNQYLEYLMGDPLRKEPSALAAPPTPHAPAQLEADLTAVAARLQRLKEHAVAPLAEAMSLLVARVQNMERLVENPPEKEPSAPAGPPAPTQMEADFAARLQRLEENAASLPAAADRPQPSPAGTSCPPVACPLTTPAMPFFLAHHYRENPPCPRGESLDQNEHLAYELAVQQGEDSVCQWFIHEVLNPTLAGEPITWAGTGLSRRSQDEMNAMLQVRREFRVLKSSRDQDYDLLVYGNNRIYVPRRGRYALIQAAHSAAHQGLGSMQGLLESSFFWPGMAQDIRRYAEICRFARATRPPVGQRARPFRPPTKPSPPAASEDPVIRVVRTVPDWDGLRGAEKIQVELRRTPLPEEPNPWAEVREAVHQAPGPNPFARAVRSVPNWDGPRGAEKIQVELTRPDVSEPSHSTSPTPKDASIWE